MSDEKKQVGLPPFEDAPMLKDLSPQERELVQQALDKNPKLSIPEALQMVRKR